MPIDTATLDGEALARAYHDAYPGLRYAGKGHDVVREVRAVNNNTKPNPKGLIVLEGLWGVDFALKYPITIEYIVVCPEELTSPHAQELMAQAYQKCARGYIVSTRVFATVREKENSAGLLLVCRFPKRALGDIPLKDDMLICVLDGLEIQGNVGTITRSCDATLADAIILTNKRIRMSHPKLIKSSMGACLKVPMVAADMDETRAWLKANGFATFLTDTRARDNYFQADYSGRCAIVAGSERYGIQKAWYGDDPRLIKIPMLGDCDSLNVGIATTIILYEAALQKRGILHR